MMLSQQTVFISILVRVLVLSLRVPFLFSTAENRTPFPSKNTSVGVKYTNLRGEVASVISEHLIQDRDDSTISLRRELGDFDELNDLFDGMILALPDLYIADTKILGATVRIWVTNLNCGSLEINDIDIDYNLRSNTRFDFNVDVKGLNIDCTFNWRYTWSVTSGSGTGQVYTDNNSAQTSLGFNSQGYDQHPPSSTSVNSCTAFIFISDMDFQGGIIGQILNTFERSIRGAVSNAIQSTACEELGSLGTTLVGDMLDYVYDLVESYLVDIPPEYKDVLNAEKQLVVPEGAKLINFSNFSSTLGTDTIGNLFQTGLNLLDEALGGLVPDPDSDDGYDLGVNRLLRYTILDEEGALAINMTNGVIFQGHDMLTETTINLNSAHLYGLDSFENFDPLNAFGQYTLGNNFFWKHLRAELSLTLVMKPSTKSDSLIAVGTDAEVRETITVSLDINDVDIDFYYLLAIEENELGSLQLGSLLHTSGLLPCILPSLFANEVTGLSAIIRSMDAPVLEGFISPGIDSIVSKAADAVYIMYESTLLKAMPNFFELTVRNITNGAISTLIDYFDDNATCAVPEDEPQEQYRILHFGDLLLSGEEAQLLKGSGDEPYGTVVRDLVTMVQEEVRAVNPLTNNLYINEGIVRNFTSQISGVPGAIGFPSDLFSSDTELSLGELTAALQLKLSNATITNIDSFGLPLKILEPISGNLLNNVFMIGTGDKPLRAMSQLTFAISDEKDTQIRNVIELGLEMSNTTVEFEALVTILESRFLQFPIEDINNLNCWLSMIPAVPLDKKGVRIDGVDPTLALNSLKVVMESTRLKIDCIECSSPLFQDLADLVNTDQAVEDLTRLTNSAVEYITEMLGGTFLQFTLDKMLVDAAKRCPHRPEFVSVDSIRTEYVQFEDATTSTSSMGLLLTLGSVIGVVLLVTAISRIIVRIVIARRHASWVSTLSCDEVANYKNEQIKERLLQSLLDRETLSMFRSPVIPSYVRFGVPLVILANIGFFLSGHLSIGASVDVDAQVAGEAIRIEGIFVFSMAESVLDMWDAGSKELAILISLLSGAWPYIKQLTVFFLWFLPPRITTVRRRESLFLWLDALGKWSFVDIFVLIISVPSFRVAIASPNDLSFIPLDFYAINVLVIPRWGLYSNMIAQLMSQFSSHLIIHFHRQIVRDFETRGKDENEEETDDHPTKLCDHLFERGYAKKGRPIAVRKGVNVGIVLTSLTFVVLLLTGVSMPSFLLSQYGLVGLVVEASPEQSSNILHSVFTIFNLLMDQARFTGVVSDHIGLGALSAIFFITVILVPMAQLLLLLQRWFGNLDRKARIRNFLIVESLQAWQYIEVYIFSVIIACWQLGTVSEYLINDYCGSFEGLFNSLAYFGILRPMDSQCFKIQAKVQSGSWILIAASVTLLLLNRIITSAAKQQVRDVEINTKEPSNISIESGDDSNQLQDVKLKPLSPSFSDTFRWLLSSQQEGGGAQLAVLAE